MIKKYVYGTPFDTNAVVFDLPAEEGSPDPLTVCEKGNELVFKLPLAADDRVYGLGEQVRGINKRGWHYESWATDDPNIHEGRTALYGAHNFLLVEGSAHLGLFFDCAGRVRFDIGDSDPDRLTVECRDVALYLIRGKTAYDVVKQFRTLIGTSYIPPKWAFGFAQSRWGYKSEADIRAVADGYAEHTLPLDMICLDIDYMERYKDFTVDRERFPDLPKLVGELREKNIRLIPIIDAGIKAEEGYSVCEEGLRGHYFCTDEEGEPYIVGVWPGDSYLPDFLSPEARKWFGAQYRVLLDDGIEGFWNDMNEPAIFYGKKRRGEVFGKFSDLSNELELDAFNELTDSVRNLKNSEEDYKSLFHNADGVRIPHERVHNLYGSFMTRAAAEFFERYRPDKRFLLFSRSSCIGMHRYGGIWTGDNSAHWEHLLLNLKMMPSLNMCGFLYAGADIGGFGGDTTEELMLRWLALAVFTPLMRNHAAFGTREKECYRFKNLDAFRSLLGIRYSLLPYLYSEYVKCALRGEMLFKPLAFEYPTDLRAKDTEDQMMVGESIMIAPVHEQNAAGRYVYLPEDMKLVRLRAGEGELSSSEKILRKGSYYLKYPLDEVLIFIKRGRVLPLAKPAENVASLDDGELTWLGFVDRPTEYELCLDDGETFSGLKRSLKTITVQP